MAKHITDEVFLYHLNDARGAGFTPEQALEHARWIDQLEGEIQQRPELLWGIGYTVEDIEAIVSDLPKRVFA